MTAIALNAQTLTLDDLDMVSAGQVSGDGKTLSIMLWSFGGTRVGISVSSDGSSCTTKSGPTGHGSSCTMPV